MGLIEISAWSDLHLQGCFHQHHQKKTKMFQPQEEKEDLPFGKASGLKQSRSTLKIYAFETNHL